MLMWHSRPRLRLDFQLIHAMRMLMIVSVLVRVAVRFATAMWVVLAVAER